MTLPGLIINCDPGLLVINKYMKAHALSMIFYGVCFHLDTPRNKLFVLITWSSGEMESMPNFSFKAKQITAAIRISIRTIINLLCFLPDRVIRLYPP